MRVGLLLPCLLVCNVIAAQAQQQPRFVVDAPTIIAFFPPTSKAEVEKNPDTNEALADFQYYASQARKALKKAGVGFIETYATAFTIRQGAAITTFRPGKVKVGYYLTAPGKKPRIEYGVMTDSDLLKVASEYFGIPQS